jgi:hypothetical protein
MIVNADPGAPGAFRYAEPGAPGRIIREAGATEVREREFEFEIAALISLEEFWSVRTEVSGTLREKLAMLTDKERDRVEKEVRESARNYFQKGRMSFPAQAIIVTGGKLE